MRKNLVSTILFIINHVFNLIMGPNPIKANFEETLLVGMAFNFNKFDHQYQFHTSHTQEACNTPHLEDPDLRKNGVGFF